MNTQAKHVTKVVDAIFAVSRYAHEAGACSSVSTVVVEEQDDPIDACVEQ